MTALLKKDFYVLKSVLVLYALITACLRLTSENFALFSILYAALLPSSAFAYDDRSRWGDLAAMMPYSTADIVLSRYALGWIGVVFFNFTGVAVRMIFTALLPDKFPLLTFFDTVTEFVSYGAVAGCFLAATLPIYFRFDMEKSRLVRTLMICIICGIMAGGFIAVGTSSVLAENLGSLDENISGLLSGSALPLLILCAALTAVSIPLSMWAYHARRR